MMQVFRSIAGKVAAGVFAVLMLVFVLTSVDWSQVTGGSRTTVGEINGVRIPLQYFQQAMQNESQARQERQGRSLTDEEIEETREAVWQQLIQERSLDAEFKRRGITVSAEEIALAIQENPPTELLTQPDFQTDGKFDIGKYQRWLRSAAAAQVIPLMETQYAGQIRQSKLLRVVTGDVYVSDAELWQIWRDMNEKVTMEYAKVIPAVAVPDSAVTLTEAELREYYEKHPDRFTRPATAYLSYVQLVRVPDASDSTAARERTLTLRKEILDGAPFEEVASRESADSLSRVKGGDLGEFGKGQMDPAFERAAFSLPVGKVSDPVLSAFGYHLIKVESRTGTKVRARHILVHVEITGAHRDLLDARADSLESLGADQLDPAALDSAARALGLTVGQANPLQKGGRAQVGFQVVPDAGVWAFQAKPGETGRLIEVPYSYFLFRLDSLQAEGVPAFESIRGAVEQVAREERKLAAARSVADDLAKRVGEGSTLAQAAQALRLQHEQVGPFTRINPPFADAKVIGAAFGLKPGTPSPVITSSDSYYMLKLVKRDAADSADFLKNYDQFRATQVRLARQDRVRSYLDALQQSAKIQDFRSQIFRTAAQAEASQPQPRS